ncbi:hypothetical protein Y032_0210g2137 [Ancylostoma ceylanicum]|uniref:Uncharacterized protein n=1 Tax=Ancylostoma ceylanicum TaxID=53326 RepID=A0A016SL76_9BILA|nr:hypothetical protein Y032_0210g2137 [Ancylostoma ceylanicum]
MSTYIKLQTAIDKRRDRGAAFLGTETGALHASSGCLLLPARSRQPESACRSSVSLSKNAATLSRPLSRPRNG